jgi:hypothetical protein
MSLIHEVPTGLRLRPTVTIRHFPGRAIRLPSRAATLILGAVLVWGACVGFTPISWTTLAGLILLPAMLVAALVELQPRGHAPLRWVAIFFRAARRPALLIAIRRVRVAARPVRVGSHRREPR